MRHYTAQLLRCVAAAGWVKPQQGEAHRDRGNTDRGRLGSMVGLTSRSSAFDPPYESDGARATGLARLLLVKAAGLVLSPGPGPLWRNGPPHFTILIIGGCANFPPSGERDPGSWPAPSNGGQTADRSNPIYDFERLFKG